MKQELPGRSLNFNAYADSRSPFRYEMLRYPPKFPSNRSTSTPFCLNAATYVAQVEDDRLAEVATDGRYLSQPVQPTSKVAFVL